MLTQKIYYTGALFSTNLTRTRLRVSDETTKFHTKCKINKDIGLTAMVEFIYL